MFYFLVIVVPFIGTMAYLIHRNNQVRRHFLQLLDRTIAIGSREEGFPINNLSALHKEYIITNSPIKKLEVVIHELEIAHGMKKSRTIANVFASRIIKLAELENKLNQLEKHSLTQLSEV